MNNVWHITSSVATLAQPVTVTFYWPWSSLNQNSFNPANAAVNHWTNHTGGASYTWDVIGSVGGFAASADANNAPAIGSVGAGQYYSRQGQYTKFSPFGISSGSPLPVELLDFTATPRENKFVELKWSTATEQNNDFFTIERGSDGLSFSSLRSVKGAGNSSSALSYADYDHAPLKGTSFYRLKQTDFDGKFSYSKVAPVVFNTPGNITVSRNSLSGNHMVDFKTVSDAPADYTIEFINSVGQVVYKETLTQFSGNYMRDYDFVSHGKGVYLVSVSSDNDKIIKKVVAY